MEKLIITGGTGTVGSSFIEKYYDDYEFYNISRNEANVTELKRRFPKVTNFLGDICDLESMINIFEKVKPDIVIHAAALKHINLAEENPTKAIEINVVGSLNVIKASVRASVPLTIGISTDKACNPDSVYGYTKSMMEYMFKQYHNTTTKFICTRFANVANSNGSVIPYWLSLNEKNESLRVTDPKMNRLMFSKEESSVLIRKAIEYSKMDKCFTLCKKMKTVNILDLAKVISFNIKMVGKRPGEKLNETLISETELKYTHLSKDGGDYIFLFDSVDKSYDNLRTEHSSANAKKMTTSEIKKLIWERK